MPTKKISSSPRLPKRSNTSQAKPAKAVKASVVKGSTRTKAAKRPKVRSTYRHGNLRQALIDEALVLIQEQGAEALNVREAARRIGVSHNAYTRHFADREALLAAVSLIGHTNLARALDDAVAAVRLPKATPVQLSIARLQAACHAYIRFALANPAFYAAMYDHTYPFGKFPDLDEVSYGSFGAMQKLVEACQAEGLMLPGSAHSHTCLCWSSAHGVANLINSGRMHFDTHEQALAFVDFAIPNALGQWPFPAPNTPRTKTQPKPAKSARR